MGASGQAKATAAALLCAAAALVLGAGCGEKEEPTGPATGPLVTGTGATDEEVGFDIRGRFSGRLTQRGLAPFRVTATIRSLRSGARNSVRYTGLDCSGRWNFLGRGGGAFRFRERITRGRSRRCKGTGTVTLSPQGPNRLRYRFSGGGVTSRGVLVRAD